jgi:hypothetical protein
MADTPTFSSGELHLMRQWFDAVHDVSASYLEPADFSLARRLYVHLGVRVPGSIERGAQMETDPNKTTPNPTSSPAP